MDKDGFEDKPRDIFYHARRGNLVELQNYKGDVNVVDDHGYTPLEHAIENNQIDCVKYLVEERNAHVNSYDSEGRGPIHMAAIYGRFECLVYLVDNGANINAVARYLWHIDSTPLSLAVMNESLDCVAYLLSKGADPFNKVTDNMSDNNVCGPLILNAMNTYKERQSIQAMMSVKQAPRLGPQSFVKVLPVDIIRRLHTYFV
jgi:ankyrin repeat protein